MTTDEIAELQLLENKHQSCNCCRITISAFNYPNNNKDTLEIIKYFRELSTMDNITPTEKKNETNYSYQSYIL